MIVPCSAWLCGCEVPSFSLARRGLDWYDQISNSLQSPPMSTRDVSFIKAGKRQGGVFRQIFRGTSWSRQSSASESLVPKIAWLLSWNWNDMGKSRNKLIQLTRIPKFSKIVIQKSRNKLIMVANPEIWLKETKFRRLLCPPRLRSSVHCPQQRGSGFETGTARRPSVSRLDGFTMFHPTNTLETEQKHFLKHDFIEKLPISPTEMVYLFFSQNTSWGWNDLHHQIMSNQYRNDGLCPLCVCWFN